VEKNKHLLMTDYIGLLGSYLQHVISMLNTFLRLSTPWSLTDTDGGYNFRAAAFRYHSLRPSQPTIVRFPLMASFGLKLTSSSVNQTSNIDE
jgi:hypothetical protein